MGRQRKNREFELIARHFAPLSAAEPGAFALTDDAAVLEIEPGRRLVVTTDTMVAGVHFLPENPAGTVAAKLLRVNLSDLAAMGAKPLAYTLSAALPETMEDGWLERFAQALAADQASFQVTLIGGDTVATPGPLTLTLCALGTVAEGRELRRSGARPGDTVYVSGTIGDAALGLAALRGELPGLAPELREALGERYLRPQPRIALGQRLSGLAHAAADISDGLVADLGHICAASGTGATVEAARIPLSPAGRAVLEADAERMTTVLAGGDDYELLFTAPPESADTLAGLSRELDLPLTAIGRIDETKGDGVRVIDENGRRIELVENGYRHFRS
ncbi:MAG: thiamine-phosphate kinase [Proteobacteria bacterium]|nr:thiamine-phosphate kinase [Pseudomonadota bacterium]